MSVQSWIVNGELNGLLSPHDRGVAYGDGVFTTMACRSETIELWSLHAQRLERDLERLHIVLSLDDICANMMTLKATLTELQLSEGVFKVMITRGDGQRGYRYASGTSPTCCITYSAMPQHINQWRQDGIHVRVCNQRLSTDPLPGVKHLNRLQQVMARAEWADTFNDVVVHEGLMLDEDDIVVEAIAANVFWVKGDVLYTPSLEQAGIRGVMRECILNQAEQLGLNVQIGRFCLEDVLQSDELFISNSLLHVAQVKAVHVSETQANATVSSPAVRQFDNPHWVPIIQHRLIDHI